VSLLRYVLLLKSGNLFRIFYFGLAPHLAGTVIAFLVTLCYIVAADSLTKERFWSQIPNKKVQLKIEAKPPVLCCLANTTYTSEEWFCLLRNYFRACYFLCLKNVEMTVRFNGCCWQSAWKIINCILAFYCILAYKITHLQLQPIELHSNHSKLMLKTQQYHTGECSEC